ncbi:hypothetical protein FOXG_18664 [Fusarium oxysporum f. sp. lycopersici 4287]|uniref:Uncharacterized protein n=2 Tax=Fusarium oxysporum TaxID=5507 RepID=A0A0J9WJF5_FUSO4|nr:hypothetical protein FOXG_18664 [Fusarium oxysporum f. sp. lycopersici 4287]EXK44748.1 hypothetical protein FOMG_03432 [Fusarium oxysporum f. sp. melonis 26406]KNB00192.1 hypothetical protein FOXG_18664 [Fusarium oxysporum f. sp. lycopersici 4287]
MEDISPWEDLGFDHLEASGCLCLPLRKDRNTTKRLPNSKLTLYKYKELSTPLHSPLGQCITAAMSSDSRMLTFGRGTWPSHLRSHTMSWVPTALRIRHLSISRRKSVVLDNK